MTALALHGVTKRFGSLTANDAVSFALDKGEILALLGENGAGKTTLMNIIFGHYTADEGHVEVFGNRLPAGATDAAIKAGVGMVHQHFTLADNMTALENIMLGTEPMWLLHSRQGQARRKLSQLATDFGLEIAADRLVADLSVGERQRVEIIKALYRGAKVLILDEPTAVLTPGEADQLFKTLKALVAKGLAIIFISHKLHEILSVSDRVVVLRHGTLVGEVATAKADRNSLAEMMVGREVTRPEVRHLDPGPAIVSLNGVSVAGEAGHRLALEDVSFDVRAQEIVGVAGVAGNGQSALADVLSGMVRPSNGRLSFRDKLITRFEPRRFINLGIARIPEDRHAAGIIGEMSVWENLTIEDLGKPPYWRGGKLINRAACRQAARDLIERFDIRCRDMDMPARLMSGGNIQKLILARTLSRRPKFILANQPVRGLDEGAIAFVHERLLEAKRGGAGVLLISEDLDEMLSLSDRVMVMFHGRLSAPVPASEVTIGEIGEMMAGGKGIRDAA